MYLPQIPAFLGRAGLSSRHPVDRNSLESEPICHEPNVVACGIAILPAVGGKRQPLSQELDTYPDEMVPGSWVREEKAVRALAPPIDYGSILAGLGGGMAVHVERNLPLRPLWRFGWMRFRSFSSTSHRGSTPPLQDGHDRGHLCESEDEQQQSQHAAQGAHERSERLGRGRIAVPVSLLHTAERK